MYRVIQTPVRVVGSRRGWHPGMVNANPATASVLVAPSPHVFQTIVRVVGPRQGWHPDMGNVFPAIPWLHHEPITADPSPEVTAIRGWNPGMLNQFQSNNILAWLHHTYPEDNAVIEVSASAKWQAAYTNTFQSNNDLAWLRRVYPEALTETDVSASARWFAGDTNQFVYVPWLKSKQPETEPDREIWSSARWSAGLGNEFQSSVDLAWRYQSLGFEPYTVEVDKSTRWIYSLPSVFPDIAWKQSPIDFEGATVEDRPSTAWRAYLSASPVPPLPTRSPLFGPGIDQRYGGGGGYAARFWPKRRLDEAMLLTGFDIIDAHLITAEK